MRQLTYCSGSKLAWYSKILV